MIRSRLFSVILVAGASAAGVLAPVTAPAAPVPKHLMKEDPLCHATRVGDRLESVLDKVTIVCVVTESEMTTEGLRVRVEQESRDGRRIHDQTVIVSQRGVKVIEYNGSKLDPPFWWVKLPHVTNNTWPDKFGEQTWTGKTVGWEDVDVPAGKFHAIHVQHIEPEPRGATSYWFALGIGCIKCEATGFNREMTAFKPGK